jgi:serine/threonine-protein kinase
MAASTERRERFRREAKALAALDHPNIVTVFSIEEADGTHFITMEWVRGKTLSEIMPKKSFPLEKFFDVAIALSDAVAADRGGVRRTFEAQLVTVWELAGF